MKMTNEKTKGRGGAIAPKGIVGGRGEMIHIYLFIYFF